MRRARRMRWAGCGLAVALVVGFAVEPASAVRAKRATTTKRSAARSAAPVNAGALSSALPVIVGTKAVVAVTPVASAGTLRVSALGTPNVAAVQLADKALAAHRDRLSRLRGAARPGLVADALSSEDIVQTTDGTYFVGTTSMNVADPAALAANGIRNVRPEPGLTLASLSASQRADFDAYKAEALRRPAGDPMHDAAAQGDQALLDAIAQGKGPVVVTTSIFVPSGNLSMANRSVQAPAIVDGEYDYSSRRARELRIVPPRTSRPNATPAPTGPVGRKGATAVTKRAATPTTRAAQGGVAKKGFAVAAAESGELASGGTDQSKSHFLTGWTIDGGVTWKETWDFGFVGKVTITAEAWYALGLRAPLLVTGTISPSNVVDSGDPGESYSVEVTADVIDGDPDFYESTDLPRSEVYDGKEFVLEAGAHVKVKGEILGVNFSETIPQNDSFDFGQQVQMPYGSCGTDCGFNLWVPADVTNTVIRVLGIVTGSAQIGFNVSGTGEVSTKFSALDDGRVIASSRPGAAAANVQTFEDDGVGGDLVFTSTLGVGDDRRPFGYRLSDPTYTWNIVATPGVKGTIDINARPFYSDTIRIGPLWIDAASFSLVSFTLPTHAGTTTSRDRQPGSYSPGLNAATAGGAGVAGAGKGAVQQANTATTAGTRTGTAGTMVPKGAVNAAIATTTTPPSASSIPRPGVEITQPTVRAGTQRKAAPATKAGARRKAKATAAVPVVTQAPPSSAVAAAVPKAGAAKAGAAKAGAAKAGARAAARAARVSRVTRVSRG